MKINDQKALIYTKEGELSAYFSKFIERFASEFKKTSFPPEQLEFYVDSILKEKDTRFRQKQTIKFLVKIANLREELKATIGSFHYEILLFVSRVMRFWVIREAPMPIKLLSFLFGQTGDIARSIYENELKNHNTSQESIEQVFKLITQAMRA